MHGLIIDRVEAGRWVRVRTTDKPRHKNGAYKFLGDIGWVQNHAQATEPSMWRPESAADAPDMDAIRRKAEAHDRQMRDGWAKAERRAAEILATCVRKGHPYLEAKGFRTEVGLVTPDGSLFVPMRHWQDNRLVGGQVIKWDAEERAYQKRFIPGMRSKGAVFRIGQRGASWLVEGFATGLSVKAALDLMRFGGQVIVTYSAGNLRHVAGLVKGERFVFADHDESQAGQQAAEATGLPWCMSPEVGQDANDMHRKAGVFAVTEMVRRTMRAVPA